EKLFALKIGPILQEKCLACHSEKEGKLKGDLDLSSREAMLFGGETSEHVLVPGNPSKSLMLTAIEWKDPDYEMPPKENDRLSVEQIEYVRKWIKLGAPWPDEGTQKRILLAERSRPITEEGMIVKTSGGLADEWTYRRYKPEDLWAFQPVKKPPVPAGIANPIDFFISSRLKQANHKPAGTADFRTLVKRAYLDLLGLPPTPYQIYQFRLAWEKDRQKAWSELLDELLESEHFGERSAQHWLDVARYADTAGLSNDYERSNMWRYRDYVVRSFNEDKPYDQFIVEQIAGDELWDMQPQQEKDAELLVATSFLRMGPWDPAMVLKHEARQLYLDDVVNAVGQTFLSTTMRCFKCHDHKFDPLPTKDYYRMYSAFNTTQLAERSAPFLKEENLVGMKAGRKATQQMLDFAKEKYHVLLDKQEAAAKEWFSERGKEYLNEDKRRSLPDEEKPPRHIGLSPEETGRLKVRRQDDWIWTRRMERYQPLAQSVYNGPLPKKLDSKKMRMPAKIGQFEVPQTSILMGGALEAPGDPVSPGVLSALGLSTSADENDPFSLPDKPEGRRLALAKWIAHPSNQLTARSIVNRVWQRHFGKPLAGNPNNFGAKGKKPTHPGLLDWLAADFVENGWRFKHLHKLIMTSNAYRMSTDHPQIEKLRQMDPNNHLLAYREPRRLSAEELRDSMLVSTGELNRAVGGLPVMPEINMEVALQPRMIQFSLAPAYQPSRTPSERNRRTLYAYRVRGQPDPYLELFNQPNPNDSCEERVSEAVSPQAFTLMNSELMNDRAIALALRIEKEFEDIRMQVKRAVQLVFGRVPSPNEWESLQKYLEEMSAYHLSSEPKTAEYPTSITRSLVEENTGETFEYEEILPVFSNYQQDKKAHEISPVTRALSDLCLVLFNSNEFMYVY
ncbi:MAG: PSD1 and planctomycete cytochrome C domain-containing protein, partial [Opitutae bacterium]